MRWIVKTSLNGRLFDELHCDGRPAIPERGAKLLIPVDDHYTAGVVADTTVDEHEEPAILRILCFTPDAYLKN